jgi:hypothetical protein
VKFEIYNGGYVGTVEWSGPGNISLDVSDDRERSWFEHYFGSEDAFLMGSVGFEEMALEKRDSSQEAFTRAAMHLAAYRYSVRERSSEGAERR